MLGLLSRQKKSSSPVARQARPWLERLEDRCVPSTLTASVTYGTARSITLTGTETADGSVSGKTITIWGVASGSTTTDTNGNFSITLTASSLGDVRLKDTDGSSNIVTITLTDTAPALTSFTAVEGSGNVWCFSGTVAYNRSFSDLTIYFAGTPISIQGKTTTVDNTGHFELYLTLNGLASDNGTVSASATDAWGLTSNTLTDTVHQTGT